jgi:hypothetical protein
MSVSAAARVRDRLGPRWGGTLATAGLAATVLGVLVGRAVLLHPSRGIVGSNPSADFQIMTWSLRWWPWAAGHWVDPLHTRLLWPPEGFPTLWMTTIPAPALLALPVTLLGGPLLAYNALMFAAVVLASAGAYLLCFELTGRAAPSVLGGLLFGLSPYMLGHTLSEHTNLVFVFPLPLLALLALRRLRGTTSPRRYVAATATLLLVLAGSSLELFADLTLLLVVVGVVALAVDRRRRRALVGLAALVALSYVACLPLLGPIGWVALSQAHGSIQGSPSGEAVDLLGLLVPTPLLLVGTHWTRTVTGHFVGNVGERDGYIGLPLLAVALLALWANRRRGVWIAGLAGAVALLLSLGPTPSLDGRPLLSLPLSAAHLPVLGNALPARMSVFVALVLACLCALWLARPGRGRLRLAVAVLVVASLAPNVLGTRRAPNAWASSTLVAWSTAHAPPGFVDDPRWRRVVAPGADVLVLPTRDRTAAGYWQVRGGLRFALAVPETPFVPPALAADPTVARLADDVLPQLDGIDLGAARLRAYVRATGIDAVVVAPAAGPLWERLVRAAIGGRPLRLAGSLVFAVPDRPAPLRATGERVYAEADGARVAAWLAYDGTRAHLHVRLRGRETVLSAPGGDVDAPAVAIGAGGRAAVLFTEWRGGEELVRVSTSTGSGWRTATLDRTTLPVWSPHVAVAGDGAVAAAWVDVRGPYRQLRAGTRAPGGVWRTATLDSGSGLGALALRAAGHDAVAVAWHDSLSNEQRVQATTYADGAWRPRTTLARGLARLDTIGLTRNAASVRWRAWTPGRTTFFAAPRHGLDWGRAERRRRIDVK